MIVDAAYIPQLGVGAERAVQQPGDTQLVIPGMVLPTVPLMLISRVSSNSAQVNNQSFFSETDIRATNQAAVANGICTLGKGMWRIQISVSSRFNYLGVNNIDQELNIVWGAWTIRLWAMYASSGVFSSQIDRTLLLDQNALLQLNQAITGPAEINECAIGVNAMKMI